MNFPSSSSHHSQNGGLKRYHWPVHSYPCVIVCDCACTRVWLLSVWLILSAGVQVQQKHITQGGLRPPSLCVPTKEGFQSSRWECHMSHQAWINIVQVYCVIGVASVSDISECGRVTAQVHGVWRSNAVSSNITRVMQCSQNQSE